jgi:HSP20 family protein
MEVTKMTLVRYLPKNETRTYSRTWKPAADIIESNEGFTITLDAPGFEKDDFTVKVHEGVLTVTGERKREEAEDTKLFRYYERPTGTFERSFRLPDYIDHESINGSYENGVLAVELKKKEEAKPHTITIK